MPPNPPSSSHSALNKVSIPSSTRNNFPSDVGTQNGHPHLPFRGWFLTGKVGPLWGPAPRPARAAKKAPRLTTTESPGSSQIGTYCRRLLHSSHSGGHKALSAAERQVAPQSHPAIVGGCGRGEATRTPWGSKLSRRTRQTTKNQVSSHKSVLLLAWQELFWNKHPS